MSTAQERLINTARFGDGPAPAGEVVEVWAGVAPVLAVWDAQARVFRTVDDCLPLIGYNWWRRRV